jgi:DMSO/TMAO reductase YedYZ molybdopterin-dependent catalytic subunit
LSDFDRRGFLKLAALTTAAAGLHVVQRPLSTGLGLAGGGRRSTGSLEIASQDPEHMPNVIWINDKSPADTSPDGWPLTIEGASATIEELWLKARPVVATLDCTGGWFSEQIWDAIPLSELIPAPTGRSVYVESATGYGRHFSTPELAKVYRLFGSGCEFRLVG